MAAWIWGLAALLVLGVAFFLVRASLTSLVFASYRDTVELTGARRLWSTHYYGLKWVPIPGDPSPCPVVIHVGGGDAGPAEWAEPKRLLDMGWVEVPFLPVVPEAAALLDPEWARHGPQVAKYGQGDLRVAIQHTGGVLTGVCVFVVSPERERIAQGFPAEHENMALRGGAIRYSLSVGGRRITLPMAQAEIILALGPPDRQRQDY